VSRLLRRTSRRYLTRHPGQIVLTVLGVALGVAVVVGIDLAVQSNRAAFRVSAETVSGRATHAVQGGAAGLDEAAFRRIRLETDAVAAPVVEGVVTTPRIPGRALRILGVDPVSEAPFRPYLSGERGGLGLTDGLLATPYAVVLTAGTAREAGVEEGDSLPVVANGRRLALPVAGLLRPGDASSRQGLRDVLVTDVAWAQEILEQVGSLSRIDLRLPDAPDAGEAPGDADAASTLAEVRALLPADAVLAPAGTRASAMDEMIGAFDLNLTALSLLALVFGMFLIYNALTFSVVQRREMIGTVRALGVTRGEVIRQVLGEAAVVGVVGSAIGLALGVVLGRGLVRLVTRTINDLYFVVSVEGLALPPSVLVKGAVLGVGTTLLAAALPAREAAAASPRSALTRSFVEEKWRALVPTTLVAGAALLVAGSVALLVVRGITVSFAALFAVILGMALLTPAATVGLMRLARPVAGRVAGILGTMASRGVVTTLSRTAPAIAALMVAVSVTVGLGVMIDSFRGTVERWLDQTLQADVYVSPPAVVSSRTEGRLDPAVVESLATAPGVRGASTYRGTTVPTRAYGELRLVALDLHPRGEEAFDFREGEAGPALAAFRREGAVLVSEPFAFRHDVGVGDSVRLPTPEGVRALPVAGVFYDYGSERGVVMMARATYDRFWDDPAVTSLALFLEPGAPSGGEAVVDALRERASAAAAGAGGAAPVSIQSNRALRRGSLIVFDRTFAITGVLRGLAFVVAFIGVLSALMALQLERARELGVLRANGLTPGQVWKFVTAQTGLMGATAGLLAIPAGWVLALIMIHVVNKRSFGWTLRMELGPEVFLQAVGLALAGALLAGIYPAWRMSRTPPATALRAE